MYRKNVMRPFEDASSIVSFKSVHTAYCFSLFNSFTVKIQEFFAQKNDASLFMFGSHSKKRPNNLVVGKTHISPSYNVP